MKDAGAKDLSKRRDDVDPSDMKAAMEAVLGRNMSYGRASQSFNVKKQTLHKQVMIFRKKYGDATLENVNKYIYRNNYDAKRIFDDSAERDLVVYIQTVAEKKYGLTKRKLREFLYKYAVVNKFDIPESWHRDKAAGLQFIRTFTKKYGSEISLRKPQPTSLNRATSFNPTNVKLFFSNLETSHQMYGPFPPEKIYNMDESGLTTVQDPPKIYDKKGQKQVGSITSAERGQLVTIITAISALGNHIPPFMIFPRVNFKDWMIKGAPPGTVGCTNPSGWSNDDIFYQFCSISFVSRELLKKIRCF